MGNFANENVLAGSNLRKRKNFNFGGLNFDNPEEEEKKEEPA